MKYAKFKRGQDAWRQTSTSGHMTFAEELFSLMTLKTYHCNNDSISETRKRHCKGTTFGD
jgi:hypothetical protein